ncbi:lysostaphin resistance A-like protein [Flavobacterium bizetiae]|uniref:CPBP family intramembrane glutamic endopeptidase n=1 Tax=Flavobacterium bizetiae TaxID=2704140 RepID=UPI003CC5F333
MKRIYFFLVVIVLAFISYLDFHYSLNGFLIISFDLFLVLYYSIIKSEPVSLINLKVNFNLIYYLLFVVCFYSLYFLCTSFIIVNDNFLTFSYLNKFEIVKVLVLYPILEELIFRKYLLISLVKTKPETNSILTLSVGFTLIHFITNSSLLYVFLLSIFLSWVYLKTRNICLTIILHVLNNFLSITNLISYLSKSISLFIILSVLIILVVFALVKINDDKLNQYCNERK